jgi:tetratricopeptide (TPR) repeat protein
MPSSRDSRSRRVESARLALPLFAAVVVGSALALGSEHTPELVGVAVGVAITVVLTWRGDSRIRLRSSAKLLVCVAAGLTAFTFVQTLPMPIGLLARISPHSAEVWSRSLAPLGESGPRWATLSVDPVATRVQVLRGAVYLAAFLVAVRLASQRRGATLLAGLLMAGGAAMALSSLVHVALGAHRVFGIYDLGSSIDLRHVSPLPNPNHLGGYLNIAFSIALASTVARAPRIPRFASAATVVLIAGTQFWIASRGAVLAMVGAAILVVWIARAARAESRTNLRANVASGGLILGALALFVLGASKMSASELTEADVSKLTLMRLLTPIVPPYFWFGAGRGAFESAFAEFRTGVYNLVFTNPEDLPLQWASEWGVPVTLAAFAVILVALRPRAVLARSDVAGGAWVALVAAGIQNIVDFSSEIPGVVLALVVCAAIVVGGSDGSAPEGRFDRWTLSPKLVAFGAPALLLAAIALVLPGVGRELREDRVALRTLALDATTSVAAMHDAARSAMLRHPAEPYYAFAVALRAQTRGDDNVMPWIEHVLERAPVYGPAHLVLERFLAPVSRSQARLELRLALEQDPSLITIASNDAPRLVGSYEDALAVAPDDLRGPRMLDLLSTSIGRRLPATAERLDEKLASGPTPDRRALLRLAERAVADLDDTSESPWCAEPAAWNACVMLATDRARAVQAAAPLECAGYREEAEARIAAGDAIPALTALREAAGRVDDRSLCLREIIRLAGPVHATAILDATIDDLARAGCDSVDECSTNLRYAAGVELNLGNMHRALTFLRRAADLTPDDDGPLIAVAGLASQSDLHAESLRDYEMLARRHPDDARWRDAAVRERSMISLHAPVTP